MIPLQILCLFFGLFMMYTTRIHLMKKNLSYPEFYFWIVVWTTFVFVTIFPQSTAGLAQIFHVSRIFDVIVVIAFMVIIFLTFQNRISHQKMLKKLEQVIRGNAQYEKK